MQSLIEAGQQLCGEFSPPEEPAGLPGVERRKPRIRALCLRAACLRLPTPVNAVLVVEMQVPLCNVLVPPGLKYTRLV
ncbi:hypothetical protein SAMN05428944_0266 [Streptomyces sp. 1222.5]|nr:hypothetical protein SAMN05428944_0266 [Streptomyces sp. 1222.5]